MATSISRLIVQTQDKGSASVRALLERLYRQLPMLAFAHLACNGQAQAVARLGIPPCHVRRCLVGFHILAARTEIAIKKQGKFVGRYAWAMVRKGKAMGIQAGHAKREKGKGAG